MRISLDKPRGDVGCAADAKSLAIAAMGAEGGRLADWSVDRVCSRRRKVGDGPIRELGFCLPGASAREVPDYFLLAGGELYLCSGGARHARVACSEPCPAFPLTWDQTEPGLDVYLDPPKCEGDFKIRVKNFCGKIVAIDVNPKDKIGDVKLKIQSQEGIPPDQQRLILDGRQLEDGRFVRDYGNIRSEPILQRALRRGGMYCSDREGFPTAGKIKCGPGEGHKLAAEPDDEGTPSATVTIKFGPGDDDALAVELDDDETRETLMRRANDKIAAIRECQGRVAALNRGAAPPSKKRKTDRGKTPDARDP